MAVDLRELAIRESEQVEWKENVADVEDVVATISAFANDWANLGGGYVVCGAAEGKDEHGFAIVSTPGLTAARFKEVEGKVMQRCKERVDPPLTPLVEEHATDDPSRRVLVFIVPATGAAHCFRRGPGRGPGADSGKYYIRRGRSTEEARNGLYRELLVRKRVLPPWDRRPHPSATVGDIDLLVLRDTLQQMSRWDPGMPLDDYLVGEERRLAALVPSLCVKEALTGVSRPRNFALLLFGRDNLRYFPGAHVIFSTYPGVDRSERYSERQVITGPLFQQFRALDGLLADQVRQLHDKASRTAPHFAKYPHRALREAVVNALVHRDYELDEPIRVTVFSNRIEIVSPGGLHYQVEPGLFADGKASPVWRNQALVWFCLKLQLAENEGQGIPTITRTMREAGCPPPHFEAEAHQVRCVLHANPRATRTAVALGFDAAIELPERFAFASVVQIPDRQRDPELSGARLRAVPVDPEAWRAALRAIDEGITHALESHRGALHVFGMAPHAVAAYLGRRLDDRARARAVHLYQFTPGAVGWEQLAPVEDTDPTPYFAPLDPPAGGEDGSSVLLAIDGMHPIDDQRREAVAGRLGAAAYHLRARTEAPLRPAQFARASADMRQALIHMSARHPGAPLHVITSAPFALIVELGRLLSPTILGRAIVHHFVPSTSEYVPVLDVVRGDVVAPRLDDHAGQDLP